MVKIYNIQSETMSEEELKALSGGVSDNKHIFLLNADFQYEIIDTETLSVIKSKSFKYKSNKVKFNLKPYFDKIKNLFKRNKE